MATQRILVGDARLVLATLPERSVSTCITSPPYFGLRSYSTAPQTWGGDPACDHAWGEWQERHDEREATAHGKSRTTDRFYGDPSRRFDGNHQKHSAGQWCQRCPAWRGELGAEPTLDLYVAHLVEVFAAVKRVLRDDGVLFLNLGDSYTSGNSGQMLGSHGSDIRQRLATIQPASMAPRARHPAPASNKLRLRQDLTGDQIAYVLSELAKARCISDETHEGRP